MFINDNGIWFAALRELNQVEDNML